MQLRSFARLLLEHWGVTVADISTSDALQKKQADFLATFGEVTVLIEEKTKGDNLTYLAVRAQELEQGQVHASTLPLRRNETLSGIVHKASRQLRSSSEREHDFRLIWFTATGVNAKGQYEQFISTLYGRTNILEMGADHYRRCYYFRDADFFYRSAVIDGAVAAHTDGKSVSARLLLNALSPRYEALKRSEVLLPFGSAVEDPNASEAEGTAFILDSNLNRKDEEPLLSYLQAKYKTKPLMKFDLGYTSASVLVGKDVP